MRFDEAVTGFLQRPLHAVLATTDSSGSISQSVVWFHLDDTNPDQMTVWISCAPTSAKARHVAQNPAVSLLVLAPHGGSYVRVHGRATTHERVTDADRLTLAAPYHGSEAELWLSEHPLPEPNVLLRIHPERVVQRGL
ncbi:MAG: pyridoxamine 5'-phosphate oxidase family protein [Acidimicrobiales bacterium]